MMRLFEGKISRQSKTTSGSAASDKKRRSDGGKALVRPRPLVLWDGECGFCRRSIVWLRSHDRFGALEFCPYQEADISPILRRECEKAVHVIKTDGQILRAGRAMLFCGRFTRWHQLARIGEWPIFLPFVELGYKIIAANRGRISKLLFR